MELYPGKSVSSASSYCACVEGSCLSLLHGQTVPTVRDGKKPESAPTCPQQVLEADPNIDCDGGSTHSAIIGLGTFGVIVYAAGWVHLQFSALC